MRPKIPSFEHNPQGRGSPGGDALPSPQPLIFFASWVFHGHTTLHFGMVILAACVSTISTTASPDTPLHHTRQTGSPQTRPSRGGCLLPTAPKSGTSDGGLMGSDFPHRVNQTHSLGKAPRCHTPAPSPAPQSPGLCLPRGTGYPGLSLCKPPETTQPATAQERQQQHLASTC